MSQTDVPASDIAEFLRSEGLPPPPLPGDIVRAMRPRGEQCFATDGFEGECGAGKPLRTAVLRWLASGCTRTGARCELAGHGMRSTFVQAAFESPRCGIFLAKLVCEAFDDADMLRLRIEGSFNLMRRLIVAVEQAQAWPRGKRLALVDDDESGSIFWAWIDDKDVRWNELRLDGAGWIAAIVSVESIAAGGSGG